MDRSGWDATSWVDQELAGSTFKDERLGRRLRKLLVQMAGAVGAPIPLACQDWASTKAAYRFLSNEAVSEAEILAGHFRSTRSRVAAADGTILVLQDTTEFSYRRARPERIGAITTAPSRWGADGRLRMNTVCGLLMHASLAVTTEGLPLGLAAIKFWTRATFKGTNALKRRVNPTRVPIETKESIRWLENMRQATALLGDPARLVHIGDRENDIYEFFCAAQAAGTHFLVRACVDRLAGDSRHTIADEMEEVAVQGRASLPAHPRAAADRQAEALSRARPDRDPCPGARHAGRPGGDRLEAHHRLARSFARGGHREARLVCPALANRAVPQGPEIRLPGRGGKAADRRAPRQPARPILYPELATVLADHAQPRRPGCLAPARLDRRRSMPARSDGRPHEQPLASDALELPDPDRPARWLPRPCLRSAARKHRDVARMVPPHGHQARRGQRQKGMSGARAESASCG